MFISAAQFQHRFVYFSMWLTHQCIPVAGSDLNSTNCLGWEKLSHGEVPHKCLLEKWRRGFSHVVLMRIDFGGELLVWLVELCHFMFLFIYLQPKLHSINHGTAYCGRDTVKVLLVLLDEEAVSPPTQNKADLSCDNESLNLFGITSVLTLFRWVLGCFCCVSLFGFF